MTELPLNCTVKLFFYEVSPLLRVIESYALKHLSRKCGEYQNRLLACGSKRL